MLSRGANVNASDETNWTPLHWAAKKKFLLSTQLLVEAGADIHCITNQQTTPLHLAAYHGATSVIEYLLSKVIRETYIYSNFYNINIYIFEMYINDLYSFLIVYIYISLKGADIDAQNYNGETPLYLACSQNEKEVVQILLDKGADYTIPNRYKKTPSQSGHTAARDYLIEFIAQDKIKTQIQGVIQQSVSSNNIDIKSEERKKGIDWTEARRIDSYQTTAVITIYVLCLLLFSLDIPHSLYVGYSKSIY